MAADGHNAALLSSQHSTSQGKVDNGLDVFHSEFVLGKSHAVNKDSAAGRGIELGKAFHLRTGEARALLQYFPRLFLQGGSEIVEAARMVHDELVSQSVHGYQRLENTVDEGDIASYAHLEKVVHELCAKERAG